MEWLMGGGPIMIPIFICSIVAVAVVMERAVSLRKSRILRPELIEVIEAIRGPEDIAVVYNRCNKLKGPFSAIIKRAISNTHLSREEKVLDIQATGRQEAQVLERMLVVLEIITAITPLLGLLGTVLGMSQVFDVIAEVGLGETKAFSSGIAQALRTTIVGLGVAIPSLIAYTSFDKKVDNLILEMEKHSMSLLNKIYSAESVEGARSSGRE